MIKDSKCLVTGYKGFIGSRLCYMLRYKEATIIGLDIKEGGVTNLKLLYKKCQDVDYVFHLGAISTVPTCANNILQAHNVNVSGMLNVLYASKACGVKRVVFASSSVAHDARTMYAVTKVMGELYCKLFRDMFKLPISILRFYNVYGIGQDSEAAVIPSFIRKLKAGESLVIEGSGMQTRDFIYVDDVAQAMVQAVEDSFDGCCDIGTGIDVSIKDLAKMIGDVMQVPVKMEFTNPRAGDVDRSVARKTAWFEPKYSLAQGLKKTIESWEKK